MVVVMQMVGCSATLLLRNTAYGVPWRQQTTWHETRSTYWQRPFLPATALACPRGRGDKHERNPRTRRVKRNRKGLVRCTQTQQGQAGATTCCRRSSCCRASVRYLPSTTSMHCLPLSHVRRERLRFALVSMGNPGPRVNLQSSISLCDVATKHQPVIESVPFQSSYTDCGLNHLSPIEYKSANPLYVKSDSAVELPRQTVTRRLAVAKAESISSSPTCVIIFSSGEACLRFPSHKAN
jgi:hypothetical protein